jgi:hypothetical protein
MGKKILIISPTPTHPANAGNRIRIFNMASFLISDGHEVHFLFSRQEKADEEAMKEFWRDCYYAVDYRKPPLRLKDRIIKRLRQSLNPHYQYYSDVDDHYNTLLDDAIQNIKKKLKFEIVLVEYIFQSRAFLNFDSTVLKVIDTHDVMTDRHKLFLREGKKPVWYSTPRQQERKGIRRADVVIAIQEKEKAHFSRMTRKPVINVGHFVQISRSISEEPRKKLLFVGSNNPSNFYGITDFIKDDFPAIREVFPDMELLIVGNICEHLKQIPEGVTLLGEADDLTMVYDKADIMINPLTIGTGLKIKMIEALGYSKVVLSTPVGAEGLEEGTGKSFLVYHHTEELLSHLKQIYSESGNYLGICYSAADLALEWNNKNGSELLRIFSQ